jgi:hypothetical protein
MSLRFAQLLLDRPHVVLEATIAWLELRSAELRAAACDMDAVHRAAETIAACPDGNPNQMITRPILPAAINMAAPPGTPVDVFVDDYVVPFIAAQRVLSRYQLTACNMQGAECNQLLNLAAMLRSALAIDRVCQQYLVFYLVFADLLPADLLPDTLRPFLSLYRTLGSEDAYTPTGVTHRLLAVLASWVSRNANDLAP